MILNISPSDQDIVVDTNMMETVHVGSGNYENIYLSAPNTLSLIFNNDVHIKNLYIPYNIYQLKAIIGNNVVVENLYIHSIKNIQTLNDYKFYRNLYLYQRNAFVEYDLVDNQPRHHSVDDLIKKIYVLGM